MEAIEFYGPVHGSWMATKRLCRCHPFHPGGFDPVPETVSQREEHTHQCVHTTGESGSTHLHDTSKS